MNISGFQGFDQATVPVRFFDGSCQPPSNHQWFSVGNMYYALI